MTHKMVDVTNPDILLISRVILIKEDSEFLMVQRSKEDTYCPSTWEFPGGKVEVGQEIGSSTKRIIFEETGLQFTEIKPMAYIDSYIIPVGKYKGRLYLGIFNFAKAVGEHVQLSHEHEDFKWVKYPDSLQLEMDQTIKNALRGAKEYFSLDSTEQP